ncbi:MAG: 3D domain-containing protein [Acidobacteriota bacterium]
MLLLQIIAGAQSAPSGPTGPTAGKIFNSTQNGFNSGDTLSNNSDTGGAARPASPVLVPDVSMKTPTLEFKLVPVESTMVGFFSSPEWSLSETRSFEATAYSLKGITRSGVFVRRGVIAADPSVLPLGSVVQVTAGNYTGVYTVHDTGTRIKGHIIDVWVPSRREALQFGRQKVRVEVLKMGLTRLRK